MFKRTYITLCFCHLLLFISRNGYVRLKIVYLLLNYDNMNLSIIT